MIEVLVALVVIAIGILGLAAMMSGMQGVQTESYARSQALLLLQEMTGRLSVAGGDPDVNVDRLNFYVTGADAPLGADDDLQPASCDELMTEAATLAADATATPDAKAEAQAAVAKCAWSNALKGAAEKNPSDKSVGAMIGARGCVEIVDPPIDPTPGVCTPGRYRVSVVWLGLTPTVAPHNDFACGKVSYGVGANDKLRRAVSVEVTIPLPLCV